MQIPEFSIFQRKTFEHTRHVINNVLTLFIYITGNLLI